MPSFIRADPCHPWLKTPSSFQPRTTRIDTDGGQPIIMRTMTLRVALLAEDTLAEAAEVLTVAFEDYPFLERCFTGAAEPQSAMRRRLFTYALKYRVSTGIPALVAMDGDEVIGVATLRIPDSPEMPDEFKSGWEKIQALITLEARELFQAYDDADIQFPGPAVYVVAIGVLPDRHGQGVGRLLLDSVSRLAESHPTAEGVGLDTHAPENVDKYLKLGFELVCQTDLRGTPNWYFWRPLK